MTRDERRAARIAVIIAEREKRPSRYGKYAAKALGIRVEQVWHLMKWWVLRDHKDGKCQQ